MDQTNQSDKKHIYKPHIDMSVNTKNMLHKYMRYDDTYEDVIIRMINVYDRVYDKIIDAEKSIISGELVSKDIDILKIKGKNPFKKE